MRCVCRNLSLDTDSGRFIYTVKRGNRYGRAVGLATTNNFYAPTYTDFGLVFGADALDQKLGKARVTGATRPLVSDVYRWAALLTPSALCCRVAEDMPGRLGLYEPVLPGRSAGAGGAVLGRGSVRRRCLQHGRVPMSVLKRSLCALLLVRM